MKRQSKLRTFAALALLASAVFAGSSLFATEPASACTRLQNTRLSYNQGACDGFIIVYTPRGGHDGYYSPNPYGNGNSGQFFR